MEEEKEKRNFSFFLFFQFVLFQSFCLSSQRKSPIFWPFLSCSFQGPTVTATAKAAPIGKSSNPAVYFTTDTPSRTITMTITITTIPRLRPPWACPHRASPTTPAQRPSRPSCWGLQASEKPPLFRWTPYLSAALIGQMLESKTPSLSVGSGFYIFVLKYTTKSEAREVTLAWLRAVAPRLCKRGEKETEKETKEAFSWWRWWWWWWKLWVMH